MVLSSSVKSWCQKIHIYLGLYFLIFLWLFSVSGLLLNHRFTFAEFYANRREAKSERPIVVPSATSDVDRALELGKQLGIAGELEWTANRPTAARMDFRISRPGHFVDVRADFAKGTAAITETQYNGWGLLRSLHTFNGVGVHANRPSREWSLTKLWTLTMDAIAVGIVGLVVTSMILGSLRRDKLLGVVIAFATGCAACGLFVFGLRWF